MTIGKWSLNVLEESRSIWEAQVLTLRVGAISEETIHPNINRLRPSISVFFPHSGNPTLIKRWKWPSECLEEDWCWMWLLGISRRSKHSPSRHQHHLILMRDLKTSFRPNQIYNRLIMAALVNLDSDISSCSGDFWLLKDPRSETIMERRVRGSCYGINKLYAAPASGSDLFNVVVPIAPSMNKH